MLGLRFGSCFSPATLLTLLFVPQLAAADARAAGSSPNAAFSTSPTSPHAAFMATPAAAPPTTTTVNAEIGDVSWQLDHPGSAAHFAPEVERIQTHLVHVVRELRGTDVRRLSELQRAKRAKLLDRLALYASIGRFPRRGQDPFVGRRPRFSDDKGVRCAVGELLFASGEAATVKRFAAAHEYAYIHDIADPALRLWAKSHGFTLRELAMIQPTYGPLPFRRTFSVDLHGGFAPIGVGPIGGLRLGITLVRPGWYGEAMQDDQDQDALRLVIGFDMYNARRRDGLNDDHDLAFGVPIAIAWESYGSSPFSWSAELGVNVYIHPGVVRADSLRFVDHWSNWLNVGVGAIWRFNRRVAALARVGLPLTSLGLRVELGDTSFRPGP